VNSLSLNWKRFERNYFTTFILSISFFPCFLCLFSLPFLLLYIHVCEGYITLAENIQPKQQKGHVVIDLILRKGGK